jgi:hypothetical protein
MAALPCAIAAWTTSRLLSANDPQLSAIERAHIAYELMMRRQREVALARLSRERTRTIYLIVFGVGFFTLLIGTAIYNNWLPTSSLRSAALSRSADDGKFAETRNGQVRSFIKGNTCQELQFSNDRGVYVGGNLVPCQAEVKREPQPEVDSKGARVNSIRDAFSGR